MRTAFLKLLSEESLNILFGDRLVGILEIGQKLFDLRRHCIVRYSALYGLDAIHSHQLLHAFFKNGIPGILIFFWFVCGFFFQEIRDMVIEI